MDSGRLWIRLPERFDYGADRDGFYRVELEGGWMAEYRLIREGDEVVFAEARVFPGCLGDPDERPNERPDGGLERGPVPAGGLTSSVLRGVNLGTHRALFFGALQRAGREGPKLRERFFREGQKQGWRRQPGQIDPPLSIFFDPQRSGISLEGPRRPGRKGHPDSYYAQVAHKYVTACEAGSRSPIAEVAGAMNERPNYVRDLVRRARERELLTPTPRGVPGGELTPKGRACLGTS